MHPDLRPQILLSAYVQGIFPMADEDGVIRWYSPDPRGIIDLELFHAPRTLRQLYRQGRFELRVNRAFSAVIEACADRSEGTWISDDMIQAYMRLHDLGIAHSVEAYAGGELSGGLYGVALGGAFFGESMFHRVNDASKVALMHLVKRLRERRFVLLDVQFVTEHLARFGAIDIPRVEYLERLRAALKLRLRFAD